MGTPLFDGQIIGQRKLSRNGLRGNESNSYRESKDK